MQLDPRSSEALSRWIGPDTWHTSHTYDMGRFYDFVNAYQQEQGNTIDEALLRDEINRRANEFHGTISDPGSVAREVRDKLIRSRISLACDILDFLQHTGR